jgi:protease I
MKSKKIGILLEGDFYENEILYYQLRFPEEEMEVHFLTRLWGQDTLSFRGHEYQIEMTCNESFEELDDASLGEFSAIIIPSGMVADRLRYTEDIAKLPPACDSSSVLLRSRT